MCVCGGGGGGGGMEMWKVSKRHASYGLQEGYRLVGVGISHIKHHTFIIQVYTPSGHAPC